MIKAGGIDLGGTKIEAQKFDGNWTVTDRCRNDTPASYPALVEAVAVQVSWLRQENPDLPVGIAAAGLANPRTGNWIAANLSANGMPFVKDVAERTGAELTWLNDCRAFTQAEAKFVAGKPEGTMVGLVLGTGIAGGIAFDGELINQGEGQSGEFGHMPIPGTILSRHNLPVLECGCGRKGCYETYGSGPGMERLSRQLTGGDFSTRDIVERREDPRIAHVWEVWCEINAALILTLVTVVDPRTIVLGGGLSQIPDLIESLESALLEVTWDAFPLPTIRLGTHGETAAALGAAYAAWHV